MKLKPYPFLFFISFIYCQITLGQAPGIRWQKTIGGSRSEVFSDSTDQIFTDRTGLAPRVKILSNHSNYIVAGTTWSNNGDIENNKGQGDIFIGEMDTARNWIWKRTYGGSGADELLSITPGIDSGYIAIGSTYSNNGDVSGNHGHKDIWVIRLGNSGQIIWQKCFGGTLAEDGGYIQRVSNDGYILIGSSTSTNGDAADHYADANREDILVIRLDKDGNKQWSKCYGGFYDDIGVAIKDKAGGGFYIGANTGSYDSYFTDNHGGSQDMWVAEIDVTGNVVKSKCFGGRNTEFLNDLEVTPSGEIVIAGSTASNNGDVSGNHTPVGPDAWVANLSPSLILQWQKCFGGTDVTRAEEEFQDIQLLPDGAIIAAGVSESNNGDLTENFGATDCWVAKISKTGELLWSKTFGGTGMDMATSISVINESEFIFLGQTSSNNINVSGNHGGFDIWLVSLGNANIVKGELFIDKNLNGAKDHDEPFYTNAKIITAKAGLDSLSASSSTGKFSFYIGTGTYVTIAQPYSPYFNVIPLSHTTTNNSYPNTDSIFFAFQPIGGINDVKISVIPLSAARPGFSTKYQVTYENVGTETIASGSVKFVKDSRLVVTGSQPAYSSIQNDTITWDYTNLRLFEHSSIIIAFSIPSPPTVNFADTLHSFAFINTGVPIIATQDDTATIYQRVTGSFDPNDKTENHGGLFKIKESSNKEYLNYLIRFQNTGNDTAFNVTIKDTLSSKLDWNTLEMIGASHNYQLNITKGNICTWKFSNILLPDSNRNEPGSHGYIAFRIKPTAAIAAGDRIDNKAHIYFDFNLPVETNVNSTTIKIMTPEQPLITGLSNAYCSGIAPQQIRIVNLPTADYGATVDIKLDGNRFPVAADGSFTLSPSSLSNGTHTITVSYSNNLGSKTSSSNFTVSPVLTPDVNLSSNIATMVTITDPAIITASNSAGGGADPLYTFSKDRSFTAILQVESSNSQLSVFASALVIGDNWIYVKMKSSDACSTKAFDIDSIKINRSAVTGLVDIDNPSQIINIYPNPFKQSISITGLNNAKAYSIYVTNILGQQLYHKQITNSSNLTINKPGLQTGTYWLSIYDEKKKRLIGTVPVVKE